MGKPKKSKKGANDDDFGDEDVAVDMVTPAADTEGDGDESSTNKSQPKKGKKGKKKKDEDWEDDVATDIAALSLEANKDAPPDDSATNGDIWKSKGGKKEKKGKKKKKEEEEEEEAEAKPSMGGMSAFQMLAMDDDESEEEEEDTKHKPEKQESIDNEEEMDSAKLSSAKQKKDKKKGKKEEKKKAEDEDLDALLAEIDKPQEKAGKKKKKKKGGDEVEQPEVSEEPSALDTALQGKDLSKVTQEDLDALLEQQIDESEYDTKKKKKKEKKKAQEIEAQETEEKEGEEEMEGEEEGGTVKTAAQKKKEKKERQKLQKQQEKEKAKQKKKAGVTEEQEEKGEKEESPAPAEAKIEEAEAAAKAEEGAEEEEDDDKKKKKKDKKKKKKGEEEEDKTKKPKKAQIKAMQEALQRMKEEEERLQRQEEEKERRAEEARRLREEKERLEKERKEKKKQKEKEKIARKKAEGTYLTAKQKEDRRRAEQMLEAMKAKGIELPVKAETGDTAEKPKKRVVYDSRPKRKRQQLQQQVSEEASTPEVTPDREETPKVEEPSEQQEETKQEQEEVKDSWDAHVEVKEAWDASDEEKEKRAQLVKKEEVKKPEAKKPADAVKPAEKEEEEEESSESEEESSSEESSEEESSEEESSEEDDGLTPQERAREKAKMRIQKRKAENEKKMSTGVLRAPVVCVLGHVDTGKTKILDKLRRTNVQDGEAGGITQQIGATNVPFDAIVNQTKMCKEFAKKELKLPGLLIIDTPGHESFSNLRSRGSSLCDIAILVIDIMHGIEPQTVESINLLKNRKTPFVVALNKIDRLYQWQSNPHSDVVNTIKKQKPNTKIEFDERAKEVIVQLAEQGLNAALFYENKNPREYVSLVPTSAHSGDGMGNLIALICELTQTLLAKRVSYSEELQATVMEVKALEGLGTTIDVILVNGKIREGDTIVVGGTRGPIATQIRGLLMPQPMRELRVKSAYEHHKEVKAAQGVKISAKDLDTALAGLPLFVAEHPDEVEILKEEISAIYKETLSSIKLEERGVFVQASTLGSLEALLEFLRSSKIPYAGINIGPVHKRDIMKASVMLEHDVQYAVILAFDVKVEREAQEMADSLGVRIFTAEIIYHLFDQFTAYQAEHKAQKKEEFKDIAVFPCKLRVIPDCVFKTRDPIVMGVAVEAGFLKEGTPVCVPSKENLFLGRVTGIEHNHKTLDTAKAGQEVCIKIEALPGDTPKMYGRHFDHNDLIVSKISRQSIDAVKDHFRDEMQKSDWVLMVELKKMFQIL